MGGLIFGVGFGILGYCPGTKAGAVGQGSLNALLGGIVGMLIGTRLFAEFYPALEKKVLNISHFGEFTLSAVAESEPLMGRVLGGDRNLSLAFCARNIWTLAVSLYPTLLSFNTR